MATGKEIGTAANNTDNLFKELAKAGLFPNKENQKETRDAVEAYLNKQKSNKSTDDSEGSIFGKYTFDILKATEAGQYFVSSVEQELFGVDDLYKKFFEETANGGIKLRESIKKQNFADIIFGAAANATESYVKQQTFFLDVINQKTSLTKQLSEDYRDEMTRAQPQLLRLGISTNDLAESAAKLVQNSGRFNLINRETFVRAGEVAKAFVGTLEGLIDMYPDFEKIGIGAADATERISAAGLNTLKLGLNSKKVLTDLQTNLAKINEYGFKNGIEGLTRMQQRATEFRISMNEVFKIADKVMSPEGAVELAANLQVLGGAIGDFNDPMKLMYMATNNVEGLQDALINAAGGLATFNSATNKFELSGVNLRRAREMATQLGVDYAELAKGAIAAAERTSAADALLSRGLTLSDEQREFITNIAQMKDGKMQIELQSERLRDIFKTERIALEDITESQVKELLTYQKDFAKLDEKDIIRNQYTAVENIKRDLNFLAVLARLQAAKGVEGATAAALSGFDISDAVSNLSEEITDSAFKEIKGLADSIDKNLKSNNINVAKIEQDAFVKRVDAARQEKIENERKNSETVQSTTTTNKQQNVNVIITYDAASSNEHSKDFKVRKKGEYTDFSQGFTLKTINE